MEEDGFERKSKRTRSAPGSIGALPNTPPLNGVHWSLVQLRNDAGDSDRAGLSNGSTAIPCFMLMRAASAE